MSQLKNKSEINYAAACLLNKNAYYPSVAHCAYYSCVQLMKHIIINTLGKSETIMSTEMKSKKIKTHDYLIQEIRENLKTNKKDWKTFHTNILQLKKVRVESDYIDKFIDVSIGKNSIMLSDIVLKNLKANFKI